MNEKIEKLQAELNDIETYIHSKKYAMLSSERRVNYQTRNAAQWKLLKVQLCLLKNEPIKFDGRPVFFGTDKDKSILEPLETEVRQASEGVVFAAVKELRELAAYLAQGPEVVLGDKAAFLEKQKQLLNLASSTVQTLDQAGLIGLGIDENGTKKSIKEIQKQLVENIAPGCIKVWLDYLSGDSLGDPTPEKIEEVCDSIAAFFPFKYDFTDSEQQDLLSVAKIYIGWAVRLDNPNPCLQKVPSLFPLAYWAIYKNTCLREVLITKNDGAAEVARAFLCHTLDFFSAQSKWRLGVTEAQGNEALDILTEHFRTNTSTTSLTIDIKKFTPEKLEAFANTLLAHNLSLKEFCLTPESYKTDPSCAAAVVKLAKVLKRNNNPNLEDLYRLRLTGYSSQNNVLQIIKDSASYEEILTVTTTCREQIARLEKFIEDENYPLEEARAEIDCIKNKAAYFAEYDALVKQARGRNITILLARIENFIQQAGEQKFSKSREAVRYMFVKIFPEISALKETEFLKELKQRYDGFLQSFLMTDFPSARPHRTESDKYIESIQDIKSLFFSTEEITQKILKDFIAHILTAGKLIPTDDTAIEQLNQNIKFLDYIAREIKSLSDETLLAQCYILYANLLVTRAQNRDEGRNFYNEALEVVVFLEQIKSLAFLPSIITERAREATLSYTVMLAEQGQLRMCREIFSRIYSAIESSLQTVDQNARSAQGIYLACNKLVTSEVTVLQAELNGKHSNALQAAEELKAKIVRREDLLDAINVFFKKIKTNYSAKRDEAFGRFQTSIKEMQQELAQLPESLQATIDAMAVPPVVAVPPRSTSSAVREGSSREKLPRAPAYVGRVVGGRASRVPSSINDGSSVAAGEKMIVPRR